MPNWDLFIIHYPLVQENKHHYIYIIKLYIILESAINSERKHGEINRSTMQAIVRRYTKWN
jgi:hypothetical protein